MKKIGILLVGGAAGAIVALLYAPRAGRDTRARLADWIEGRFGAPCYEDDEGEFVAIEDIEYIDDAFVSEGEPADADGASSDEELRQKIEAARARITEQVSRNVAAAGEAVRAKAPVAAQTAKNLAAEAADIVTDLVDEVTDKAGDVAGKVGDVAGDVIDKASDMAEDIAEKVGRGEARKARKAAKAAAEAEAEGEATPEAAPEAAPAEA